MDNEQVVKELERQLRIRAMFAFERGNPTPMELRYKFARVALDLTQRQPAMTPDGLDSRGWELLQRPKL